LIKTLGYISGERQPLPVSKSRKPRKGVGLMEQMFGFIANLGFPIVISVYLLVRIENRLVGLSQSIQELASAINSMK